MVTIVANNVATISNEYKTMVYRPEWEAPQQYLYKNGAENPTKFLTVHVPNNDFKYDDIRPIFCCLDIYRRNYHFKRSFLLFTEI